MFMGGGLFPTRSLAVQRLLRIGLLTCVVFLACSCTDTASVHEFARASQQVGAEFPPMAADGLASCHRASTFLLAGQTAPDCTFFQSIEPPLLAVNNSLFAYISSLGKLADVNTGELSGSLKNLGPDLQRADPGISAVNLGRADAAVGLAGALVNVLASGYKQKKMMTIIEHSNDSVQKVAGFLDEYAAYRYAEQIRDEEMRERAFCIQWTDPAVPEVAREPIAVDLLKRRCAADYSIQTEKLAAIKKYQDALKAVASAHQKLYDQRNKWNTAQLITSLAPAVTQISDAATAMNKAF
jgi:hypothetical protein